MYPLEMNVFSIMLKLSSSSKLYTAIACNIPAEVGEVSHVTETRRFMAVIHLAPSWVHVRVTNKVCWDTPKPRHPLALPLRVVGFVEKLKRGKNILIWSDPETNTEILHPRCPHTPVRGGHVTACDLSENYAVHVVALPSRNVALPPLLPPPFPAGSTTTVAREMDGLDASCVFSFSFSFSSSSVNLMGRLSIATA